MSAQMVRFNDYIFDEIEYGDRIEVNINMNVSITDEVSIG